MVSAAEQMAANLSWSSIGKAKIFRTEFFTHFYFLSFTEPVPTCQYQEWMQNN